ncbi:putative oxidoreductase (fragment) [Nostocoides australiense Ben110]|uniref:Putative oxidoreductase n=1 Tax=Nostocoides australiense Ben110 TaxID=1193182 RepID=W6K1D8_9MICO
MEVEELSGRRARVTANTVIVAAGATQTPALLLRSQLGGPAVGRNLAMHPTVKVVAHVPGLVNDPFDVPTYQVKEFAPWLSLGGSAGAPSLLALQLADTPAHVRAALGDWRELGSYYAAITSAGRGRVRLLRGRRDPLVTYALTSGDIAALRSGMGRLLHLLLAAGATRLYPSYANAPAVDQPAGIPAAVAAIGRSNATVMTVHLMGTARMGSNPDTSVTDSRGRVHGVDGLRVCDASVIPDAPGVNPQGTILALAHRTMEDLLR